ncbi:MAG: ABC transporter permease subunit [Bacteroidota bacterium]
MNGRRVWTVARHELRTHLTGPLFWVLVALMVVLTMSLNPTAMIPSDDTAVGGVRAFANSPYALAQFFGLAGFFLYPFFVSILAGMAVVRDDEARVSELLHSTPLTPAEYVAGKVGGAALMVGVAVLLHLGVALAVIQFLPNPEIVRGPFRLLHFVSPILLFALPGIVWCAGLAFAAGERTRRPIAVYAVPIAYFMVVTFVLWTWNPAWLPESLNRLLMVLDPTGLRWLRQTLFAVDRGVAFYNTAPLALDATFWLNRLVTLAVPLAAVAASVRHCRQTMGGDQPASRWVRRRRPAPDPAPAPDAALLARGPLRDLGMTSRSPGFWASTLHIARAELRELRGHPALYLFLPFIVFLVLEFATEGTAALGAPVIYTAGFLAIGTVEIVTVLVCLLLLFYTVESVHRETTTGFGAILFAAPFRTGALLLAKSLANAALVAVILAVCLATSLTMLAGQAQGRVEVWPFVLVWGLCLVPTFFVWNTFVTATLAVVRSRYLTYAVGLGALVFTFYRMQAGTMTWVDNWPLWATLRWSDMGTFPLNGEALLLNRLLMVSLGVLFGAVAGWAFPRTERDAAAALHRLRPRRLARTALRLAPLVAVPLLLGGYIAYEVNTGFQSGEPEAEARAYWRQNVATWKDVPPPEIAAMDLAVDLEPAERRMAMAGTFTLVNRTDGPMPRLPFTVGRSFGEVTWTLGGAPVDAEDRAGLDVLSLPKPLAPGDTAQVGFSYGAVYPDGFTRNGGGMRHFILPAGVLLSTLRGDFLPTPGFVEAVGRHDGNRADPAETDADFWRKTLPPIGGGALFDTRVEATAPSAYTVTSVGVKTSERTEAGRTTVVWESDHPVSTVNLIAGRWAVAEQGGNAVYHHPGHDYNVEAMLEALAAARDHYSEWFHPYPWQGLRLNEVPNLEANATGFPTNISFSETSGFLTKRDRRTEAAFVVTAHEAAHQWWGNLLRPGEGPGADVLIEGAAHYSTLRLREAVHGLRGRIAFATQIEATYTGQRRVDSEPPLARITGSGRTDGTLAYNKGAWALWMLHTHLGDAAMQAGLRAFFDRYVDPADGDYPALHDFIETLRPFAPDSAAYQDFVDQWFFEVVLPEYQLSDVEVAPQGERWLVSATVENVGTGTMTVEVAATRGERFEGYDPDPAYAEARTAVRLAPRQPERIALAVPFEPERLTVDPDALVLQLNRDRAAAEL